MHQRRIDFIDTLRAVAAGGVIVYHLRLITSDRPLPLPDWAVPITDRVFEAGVPLFFVISGFLLTMLMPSYGRNTHPTLAFYAKRYFRIAPMFYTTIVIYCVWARTTPSPFTTLTNLTFVFNLFPSQANGAIFATWTIGVEMLFYLVFPVVYRLLPNLALKTAAFFGAVVVSTHFNHFISRTLGPNDIFVAMNFFYSLPLFLLGMMAFDILRRLEGLERYRRQISWLLLLGCVLAFHAVVHHATVILNERYWQGIACVLLLLAFALHPPRIVNAATAFLGRISYSTYLLHGFVIVNLRSVLKAPYRWGLHDLPAFGIVVVITFAAVLPLSALTYALVEKPGNALGLRVVRWLNRRPNTGFRLLSPAAVFTPPLEAAQEAG